MKDYAFLKTDSGQMICGFGPFSEHEQPPDAGVAFYVNDFALSDSRPWKVPQQWWMAPDLARLRTSCNGVSLPVVQWEVPPGAPFESVYSRIKEDIGGGAFQKSVPVFTENGALKSGNWEALLEMVERLPAAFFSYGFREGDRGFLGATPELLFATHGNRLETMALAGTAKSSEVERFEADPKEISEHEFVAEYLCRELGKIGSVSREPRQLLRLGPIAHLLSTIHVDLSENLQLNDLIRFLHPTPALGALPRNEGTLGKLHRYREELGAPDRFGSPFGAWVEGVFHAVVAIRNVVWEGDRGFLAAGCGVIEASVFENEWRELGLKRAAVKRMLGL